MKEGRMKVYITKYALTAGICIKEVEMARSSPEMVVVMNGKHRSIETYDKPYWHLSPTEAEAHAEGMRKAKIASLERNIAKLWKAKLLAPEA